jgi:hypothetical protein
VESKLLEYLARAKPATFALAYDSAIETLAHPSWKEQIERMKSTPNEFRFFDPGQIIKHYLGLRSASDEPLRLIYLFWQPTDHDAHPLFAQHRAEIDSFAKELADPNVSFQSLSYDTLFSEWERARGDAAVVEHVQQLRRRYEVAIFKKDGLATSP